MQGKQVSLIIFTLLLVHNTGAKVKGNSDTGSSGGGNYDNNVHSLHETWNESVAENNFLIGIARTGVRSSNGTHCGKELELFLSAIANQDYWALKVVDSFGIRPKSFTWGNYFWFSSKDLCDDFNQPYAISLSDRNGNDVRATTLGAASPFPVRFWIVYFNFMFPRYIDLNLPHESTIHVGLCLPASCELSEVIRYSQSYFDKQKFTTQRHYQLRMQFIDARAPEFSWKFLNETGSIIFIMFLGILILLMTAAHIVAKTTRSTTVPHSNKNDENRNTSTRTQPAAIRGMENFLLCFHLNENLNRAIKFEDSRNFLGVIAGIRTIICLWVTIFHVYFYSMFAISNNTLIFAKLENLWLQPVLQSCFYVDVFFVISAFLLVYNFLSDSDYVDLIRRNDPKTNGKLFVRAIAQRYFRLMPVMFVVMLLSDIVFDFLNMYSPFRLDHHTGVYCKETWWQNLFLINNFLDMKNICASWTWYLGCEMQFFVLFTVLLFVYAKNEKNAQIAFVFLMFTFLGISFICNFEYRISFRIDDIYSTLEQLYVKPWVRINPYFGGGLLGWLFHKIDGKRIQLTGIWKVSFWTFCAFTYIATIFMSYWRSAPVWVVATIMSLGKSLFSLFVGSIILLCACGNGGKFNSIMGSRAFLFLNKFCFSIYMIAPVVVVAIYGLRSEATNFNEIASGTDFLGIIVISMASAFLLVVLVEIPFLRVANRFLSRTKST